MSPAGAAPLGLYSIRPIISARPLNKVAPRGCHAPVPPLSVATIVRAMSSMEPSAPFNQKTVVQISDILFPFFIVAVPTLRRAGCLDIEPLPLVARYTRSCQYYPSLPGTRHVKASA